MQDFARNTPDKMDYSELADRTSFKMNKEGEDNMCQIMEETVRLHFVCLSQAKIR